MRMRFFILSADTAVEQALLAQSRTWPSFSAKGKKLDDPFLGYNIRFWKHEWLKHGTCAFKNRPDIVNDEKGQASYFKQAGTLHEDLDKQVPPKTFLDPKNGNIRAGVGYPLDRIFRKFIAFYGTKPNFRCSNKHDKGFSLISEVSWCFNKQFKPIDCPPIPGGQGQHQRCSGNTDDLYGFQQSATPLVGASAIPANATSVASRAATVAAASTTQRAGSFNAALILRSAIQPANKGVARTAALNAGMTCLPSAILGAVAATKTTPKQASLVLKGTFAFNNDKIWALSLSPQLNASSLGKAVISRLLICTGKTAPWLVVKTMATPPTSWLFSAKFTVDVSNKLVWLSASTGNYMYLLDEASRMFSSTFGFTPSTPPVTTVERYPATMSLAAGMTGLQSITVQIGATLTPTKLATRLGFSWPFDDSFLTIANPYVSYTGRKVAYPDRSYEQSRLSIGAVVKIPGISLTTEAAIDVISKQSITLTLLDPWVPPWVPHLEINPLGTLPSSLTISSAVGIQGYVSANFVDIPVKLFLSIASKQAQAKGVSKLTLSAEANNVNLGKLLPTLWPTTPSFVVNALKSTTITRLVVGYSGGKYSLLADISVLQASHDLTGFQWHNATSPFKFVSLGSLSLSITQGEGMTWKTSGRLVDIPVDVLLSKSNRSPRMDIAVSAKNVNMANTARAMWSKVPAVVTDTLQKVTFTSLASTTRQDTLFVSASTPSVTFRAGMDRKGMRLVAVGLPGTLSFGSILSDLGVTNAASLGDILTVSDVTIVYVPVVANSTAFVDEDGTRKSPGLNLNMMVAVPALSIPASELSLLVATGAGAIQRSIFKWTADFQPIQHVTLQGVQLTLTNDGLVGTTVGKLVNVPVTVDVTLANKAAQTTKKLPAMTIHTVAKNVNIDNIVKTLWPSTPALVTDILSPVAFAELRISYNSNIGFGISGNPDLSAVPELRTVLEFLSLGTDAIVLRSTSPAELELAVTKSWIFSPGAPFVGDATVAFDLALQKTAVGMAARLQGSFTGVLSIDIFENPMVSMACQAGFQFSSTGSSLSIGVSFKGTMFIKGLPFITLNELSGSLSINPSPLSITAAQLRVDGQLVSTRITTELVYEAARGVFGMQVTVDYFSLEETLAALGIDVELGIANVEIRNAHVAYATVDINERLRAGMHVEGQFALLGLTADVDFSMNSNGMQLAATLDFSALTDAFYDGCERALQEISIDLQAVGINLRDTFSIERFSIDLVLTKTQKSFRGDLRLVLLGNAIGASINVDASNANFFLDAALGEVKRFFTGGCTRESYDRGVGRIPTGCAADEELFSGLCYKKCTQNWQYGAYGRDNVCYQNCPPGYNDDDPLGQRGLTCSKLECDPGFRYDGALLCFENCRSGWSSDGAFLCYENCPPGWDYVLLSCQRFACNSDEDDNGAGLCFKKCDPGWYSDGAFLCLSGCPDGYRWDPLSCWRDYTTYGKGCCCTIFGCCGCNSGYYDAGCFCARDAHLMWRDTYTRGSRAKLSTYVRASYVTQTRSAIKSFTKHREDRGVGKIPTSCSDPEFPSYEAGLCYRRCAPGYDSFVTMCIKQCPQGYTNCGTFCVPSGIPLGCGAFVGAIYQNCGDRYAQTGRRLLAGNHSTAAKPVGNLPASKAISTAAVGMALPASMACNSTKPGCTSSLDCFCHGVESGLRFSNPFARNAGFIVCHVGRAILQDCGPGAVFDGKLGSCKLSIAAAASIDPCVNASDGVYARKNTSGGYEVYQCRAGRALPAMPVAGQVSAAAGAKAVPPGGKLAPQNTVAAAASKECKTLDCFCQGKEDGLYLDTLSPGAKALEAAGPKQANTSVPIIATAYKGYIRCAAGVPNRESCPEGTMFHVSYKNCTRYTPPASGTRRQAPPGCKNINCACQGRADGMYAAPGNSNGGVICSRQKPHPFTCPAGFAFKAGAGCASSENPTTAQLPRRAGP